MAEIPSSIGVAAFVFGLVLILAALIGKEIKIAAIELPAMDRWRRGASAVLGLVLVGLSLFVDVFQANRSGTPAAVAPVAQLTPTQVQAAATLPPTTTSTQIAPTAIPPTATSTPPSVAQSTGTPVTPANAEVATQPIGTGIACFADVAEDDTLVISVERLRRTDRNFSHDQPRDAVVAVQFKSGNTPIGAVKFRTGAGSNGFDILAVVDAACKPVTTYSNVSRQDQPKDAPYYYDTMEYRFGNVTVAMDMATGEGDDRIAVRAQQTAP